MMHAEPRTEHQWLQKLVGEWTCEAEMVMKPGEPPSKSEGFESVRSIGGLWIVAEGHFRTLDGSLGTSIMTLGYDPVKAQFVGTWIGSMMTHLWIYTGKLEGNTLPLNSEGPAMADPSRLAAYQDTVEFIDDDYRTLSTQALGDDGRWNRFMVAHYRRKT